MLIFLYDVSSFYPHKKTWILPHPVGLPTAQGHLLLSGEDSSPHRPGAFNRPWFREDHRGCSYGFLFMGKSSAVNYSINIIMCIYIYLYIPLYTPF